MSYGGVQGLAVWSQTEDTDTETQQTPSRCLQDRQRCHSKLSRVCDVCIIDIVRSALKKKIFGPAGSHFLKKSQKSKSYFFI